MIPFACPDCHIPLEAPDDLAGQTLPCPACRRVLPVPPEAPALHLDYARARAEIPDEPPARKHLASALAELARLDPPVIARFLRDHRGPLTVIGAEQQIDKLAAALHPHGLHLTVHPHADPPVDVEALSPAERTGRFAGHFYDVICPGCQTRLIAAVGEQVQCHGCHRTLRLGAPKYQPTDLGHVAQSPLMCRPPTDFRRHRPLLERPRPRDVWPRPSTRRLARPARKKDVARARRRLSHWAASLPGPAHPALGERLDVLDARIVTRLQLSLLATGAVTEAEGEFATGRSDTFTVHGEPGFSPAGLEPRTRLLLRFAHDALDPHRLPDDLAPEILRTVDRWNRRAPDTPTRFASLTVRGFAALRLQCAFEGRQYVFWLFEDGPPVCNESPFAARDELLDALVQVGETASGNWTFVLVPWLLLTLIILIVRLATHGPVAAVLGALVYAIPLGLLAALAKLILDRVRMPVTPERIERLVRLSAVTPHQLKAALRKAGVYDEIRELPAVATHLPPPPRPERYTGAELAEIKPRIACSTLLSHQPTTLMGHARPAADGRAYLTRHALCFEPPDGTEILRFPLALTTFALAGDRLNARIDDGPTYGFDLHGVGGSLESALKSRLAREWLDRIKTARAELADAES
jgi:hypothetical protein